MGIEEEGNNFPTFQRWRGGGEEERGRKWEGKRFGERGGGGYEEEGELAIRISTHKSFDWTNYYS